MTTFWGCQYLVMSFSTELPKTQRDSSPEEMGTSTQNGAQNITEEKSALCQ